MRLRRVVSFVRPGLPVAPPTVAPHLLSFPFRIDHHPGQKRTDDGQQDARHEWRRAKHCRDARKD